MLKILADMVNDIKDLDLVKSNILKIYLVSETLNNDTCEVYLTSRFNLDTRTREEIEYIIEERYPRISARVRPLVLVKGELYQLWENELAQ